MNEALGMAWSSIFPSCVAIHHWRVTCSRRLTAKWKIFLHFFLHFSIYISRNKPFPHRPVPQPSWASLGWRGVGFFHAKPIEHTEFWWSKSLVQPQGVICWEYLWVKNVLSELFISYLRLSQWYSEEPRKIRYFSPSPSLINCSIYV